MDTSCAYSFGGNGSGPQCSSHDDFCFFCSFEHDPNAERGTSSDLYGSLKDLAMSMDRDKKEFASIVEAVHRNYDEHVRPLVHCEKHGSNPEWTKASIRRHLCFSSQFSGVVGSGVVQIFHSLVSAHNDNLIDGSTGAVIESERAALMSTLGMMMKWVKFHEGRDE